MKVATSELLTIKDVAPVEPEWAIVSVEPPLATMGEPPDPTIKVFAVPLGGAVGSVNVNEEVLQ